MERQITVRLPEHLESRLGAFARERGIARSEVVREALRSYLEGPARPTAARPYDRIRELSGIAHGGPSDLAPRHREYLEEILDGR